MLFRSGRVIAADLDEAAAGDAQSLERALSNATQSEAVSAVCVFTPGGARLACAGDPAETDAIAAPRHGASESLRAARGSGRRFEGVWPGRRVDVVLHLRADADPDLGASLLRLVALYMSVFALALLVFAYFSLTRLIVRPVEQLVEATDRIASGARTLRFPRSGARELVELGASVQAMAGKLMSEEAALILKVDELTDATKRLTQAQAQLVRSERMASVGRLAAGVAHEIGNPIAALIGMQELLLEGDVPATELGDFLRRMRKETERIHTVVRDLLDFARPEERAAETVGRADPADVAAVACDVVSLVRPQRFFRSVRVETEIDAAPLVVLSAARLTQVLLNLVLNAAAAIESSGRQTGRITIRARAQTPDTVRIEVEDDGPGIDPAVRDRLFEPFVTTKAVGEGTGLGLAVCRGLVESAGGEIAVDPSYVGGSRFVVVLPVG